MTSILVTVLTTTEDPPESFATESQPSDGAEAKSGLGEIMGFVTNMPPVMMKLGVVQFFSLFAFFTMWSFATPALTEAVFAAPIPQEGVVDYELKRVAYEEAANAVSSSMGVYGLSSMAFALLLSVWTARRRLNRRWTHLLSLAIGGLGFISMSWWSPESSSWLNFSFACVGICGKHFEHALRHVVWCRACPENGGWHGRIQHVHRSSTNRGCLGRHRVVEQRVFL